MNDPLAAALQSPALLAQLAARCRGLPDDALLSAHHCIAGNGVHLLDHLPADQPYWYSARPEEGWQRLAIGHVHCFEHAGEQRFSELAADWQAVCERWHDEHAALGLLGFAFSATPVTTDSPSCWPAARLCLPRVLIEQDAQGLRLQLTARCAEVRHGMLPGTIWRRQTAPPLTQTLLRAIEDPAADRAWLARAEEALTAIATGQVDKLVLARTAFFHAAQPPAQATVLRQLNAAQGSALIYAHGQGERVFLGATPERLCRKRGKQIEADALAGTAWPGSPQLAASKNQREQSFVAHAVDHALRPFCQMPPERAPVLVRQAGPLQHLNSRITAQARPGTSPWSLLAALHPTPAVNGFPGEAARRWLSEHGEHRPAWYSGGIGHIDSQGDCDLHVALRCATIDGCDIAVHAGAGLVAGADPMQEFAETQAKMAIMRNALNSHSAETIAQQNEGLEAYT